MRQKKALFSKKTLGHFIFWILMLTYYTSSSWPFETNKIFLFERMFSKIVLQIILSYVTILVLLPFLLNRKRKVLFVISSVILVYTIYVLYTAIRCYYLVPKYSEIYSVRPPLIFIERITNIYAFLGSIAALIVPTILLMVYDYFKHQKEVSVLKEQKKTNELNLLKTQLNPHFLFNTLNNLYTLALKKSDSTPVAIIKLSEILDYMLYQCKDKFVPLINEVNLVKNYIALEKIRYGKRLNLTFNHSIKDDVKIAPLLLLTFLENAFKHGISQEINVGTIEITLQADRNEIYFKIENSKPKTTENISNKKRDAIGLENIKKQLEILYKKNKQILNISEDDATYLVILKLIPNDI